MFLLEYRLREENIGGNFMERRMARHDAKRTVINNPRLKAKRRTRRRAKRLRLLLLLIITIFSISCLYRFSGSKSENSKDSTAVNANHGTNLVNDKDGTYGTKKDRYKVVVDAGHGGIDAGAIGPTKTMEKDNTLSVALKLGKLLESKAIEVIYTRTSDKTDLPSDERPNLEARTAISNNAKADLFISIHNNSSTYKDVRGVETYYYGTSSKSKALANSIQSHIVEALKLKDRGIREEDFYVLKNTSAPSALVELGYITNREEENILKSSSYQDKYAQAIADAVFKYLDIK